MLSVDALSEKWLFLSKKRLTKIDLYSAGVRCHERIKRREKCEDIQLILDELRNNNCPIDSVTPKGQIFIAFSAEKAEI